LHVRSRIKAVMAYLQQTRDTATTTELTPPPSKKGK